MHKLLAQDLQLCNLLFKHRHLHQRLHELQIAVLVNVIMLGV